VSRDAWRVFGTRRVCFCMVSPESCVPLGHLLRKIRDLVREEECYVTP
jgi:hypothetical protein